MGRIIVLLSLAAFASLPAQNTHTSKVAVPDDPVVRQSLTKAEEAFTNGDLDRGLKILQDILDRQGRKVVQVHRGARTPETTDQVVPGDRFLGTVPEVFARIAKVGPNALNRYRELFEPKAAQALALAMATESESGLQEIVQRYPLTDSGKRAGLALIDLHLELGQTEEARLMAGWLRRLLEADSPLVAALAVREATALYASGRTRELSQYVASLSEATAGTVVRIGGREKSVRDYASELVARPALRAEDPSHLPPDVEIFRRRMWSDTFDVNLNGETAAFVFYDDTLDNDLLAYHPVLPCLSDGRLILNVGNRLEARNILTGEALWPPVRGPVAGFEGRRNFNLFFQASTDGELIFAFLEGTPTRTGSRAWQGFAPIEPIPSRRLIAVEANTGTVRWSHFAFDAKDQDEAQFLSKLIVNQAPLIVGDTLFVAGTIFLGVFHQWVCALDRTTGHVRWKTYVGSGQMELNMFGNPIKEAVPGLLAEHQGVLYGSTNVGTIYALEAASGLIKWESAYAQEPVPGSDYTLTMERYPGWAPARPVVVGERVFVAPTDSYHLYAAQVQTGELRPVEGASRTYESRNRYFLGVRGGNLIVAGRAISAFDAVTLARKWRSTDVFGGRSRYEVIAGYPAASEELIYFVTGSDAQTLLHVVEVKSGKFVKRQELDVPGRRGNLAIQPDAMIVANEGGIDAFFDLTAVKRRLERLASENNADPGTLISLGDVLSRQRQWGQALSTYEKAVKAAKQAGPAQLANLQRGRLSLYNLWLELARQPSIAIPSGPSKPEDRFLRALEFAESRDQSMRAILGGYEWAIAQKDFASEARLAKRLLVEFPNEPVEVSITLAPILPDLPSAIRLPLGVLLPLVEAARATERGDGAGAVRAYQLIIAAHPDVVVGRDTAWSWAGRKIKETVSRFGEAAYRSEEEKAQALFAEAKRGGNIEGLRTILRLYPQSQCVEAAWTEISRRLLAAGSYREALAEIHRSLLSFRRLDAQTLVLLERCLEELKADDSAFGLLTSLSRRFSDVEVTEDEGRKSVRSLVEEKLKAPRFSTLVVPPAPLDYQGNLDTAWKLEATDTSAPTEIVGQDSAGMVYVHMDGEVRAIEPTTGQIVWKKTAVDAPRRLQVHDGLCIGMLDGDLTVSNAASGEERWRLRPSEFEIQDFAAGHGKLYLLIRDLSARIPVALQVLDPWTGDPLHRIPMDGFRASLAGTRSLFVSPSYLLIRPDQERAAACLDGYTLTPVGPAITWKTDAQQVFLTDDDLLVTVAGSSRVSSNLRISGRVPTEPQDRWAFDAGSGSLTVLGMNRDLLAISLLVPPRGRNNPNPGTSRLLGIDLLRGTTRFTSPLKDGEFVMPPLQRLADRLFFKVRMASRTTVERLRVIDAATGESPWSSVDFVGADGTLEALPSQSRVLILRMTQPRNERAQATGELFLLDSATGAVLTKLELGGAPAGPGDRGLIQAKGRILVNTGQAILGLK